MTIRQLAETAGCGISTVKRVGKLIYPDVKSSGRGIALDYNREQSIALMKELPKKEFVDIGQMTQPNIGKMTQVVDYELIGKMIGEAVRAAVAPLYGVMEAKKDNIMQIEAPEANYRDMLRQIIMKYAKAHTSGDVREAWGVLYEELYYRCKISVRTKANNTGISKLDVIEEEGLLQKSYLIMIQMMGE